MSKYTPVFVFRCKVCGGENVLVYEGNPEEEVYECDGHGHGETSEPVGVNFEHSGVGKLKDHYAFEGFHIVMNASAPLTLEDEFSKEEADLMDIEDSPTYSDYFECVLKGRERPEVAEERGVTTGTVTANIRHAKDMLAPEGDEGDES